MSTVDGTSVEDRSGSRVTDPLGTNSRAGEPLVVEPAVAEPLVAEPAVAEPLVAEWRTLLERHARVTGALERALTEHGLGVSEFEVLDELASHPGSECRMQALSDVVHLSQSALSRVVGRLEDQGLVTRFMCQQDRRGIFAQLTAEGRARYEAARPTHRAVLALNLR